MNIWKLWPKMLILTSAILFLVACGIPTMTPNPPASIPTIMPSLTATALISKGEDLAQAFTSAYASEQAADYLALFSYDAIFLDNSTPYRNGEVAVLFRHSESYVNHLFKNTNFDMKLISHTTSRDGRFVALTGTYTDTGKDGNLASVPIVIILEVIDGKIIREDQYCDNSPFY